jgi:hypothetical protein
VAFRSFSEQGINRVQAADLPRQLPDECLFDGAFPVTEDEAVLPRLLDRRGHLPF